MKNIIIKKSILFATIFLLVLTSCDNDFNEINTDPNGFTSAPTEFFLAGSILSIANAENNYFAGYLYPSLWIQHTVLGTWDQPGNYFYEERSTLWPSLYRGPLPDLDLIITRSQEENNISLEAVAKILQAYSFSLLVNAYGDIPYTESFRIDENINQPVYDTQSDVFDAILENLRQADSMLTGITTINTDTDYDILYNGDALKWRKFANSLRFRLLMQLSGIRDVSSEIASISPMFESSSDNAIYQYSGATVGNTYSPAQAIGPSGTDPGHRMAAPLIDRMNQTDDPRRPIYAVVNDDDEYLGANADGAFFGEGNNFSPINSALFDVDKTITLLSYDELLFLHAEATQKGLISGDETVFLENAITEHMQGLGISSNDISNYTSNITGNGTTLEEIYLEKWVSMFGRAMQAWVDYRRTGVPALTPNPAGVVDVIPYRFPYPVNEQTTNRANYEEAIGRLSNGNGIDSELIWTIN